MIPTQLEDFLKKRILRTCREQMTIQISGLGIKENEDGHGGAFRQ